MCASTMCLLDMKAAGLAAAGAYLNEQRPVLLGAVSSHELLELDNCNRVLTPSIQRDASIPQFVYVDEPACIGCRALPAQWEWGAQAQ